MKIFTGIKYIWYKYCDLQMELQNVIYEFTKIFLKKLLANKYVNYIQSHNTLYIPNNPCTLPE